RSGFVGHGQPRRSGTERLLWHRVTTSGGPAASRSPAPSPVPSPASLLVPAPPPLAPMARIAPPVPAPRFRNPAAAAAGLSRPYQVSRMARTLSDFRSPLARRRGGSRPRLVPARLQHPAAAAARDRS